VAPETLMRRFRLTRREVEVTVRLIRRETLGEIAQSLGIGVATVRQHAARVRQKRGVSRSREIRNLVAIALTSPGSDER
jgi:DNA-binding CsgD family transcriptional regulator